MRDMSNGRANKGGQVGSNGEFYEGGKFLPSTKRPKRHGSGPRGAGRCLIEPGVFAIAPEGKGSIFGAIRSLVKVDNGSLAPIDNPLAIECHGGAAALETMIAAYNRGERWRDL
jgi:hypothetical protein